MKLTKFESELLSALKEANIYHNNRWVPDIRSIKKTENSVAIAVKSARMNLRMTQDQLADKLGISRTTLGKIENGSKVVDDRLGQKLSRFLKIDRKFFK